ncbi:MULTISPECIES: universal stress protein [Streptomycetaceae]|uniref:Stress-inducible protein n=1 Tax=Streptantibioticus cattleyicolor (strain ATCC 35852 / DSM 46488 / JCM 4925 / NBRC 14057 / NRRL 8057) TaxID=1003195 RepID=F8JTX9_STREN|nr:MULTISPECIES: universal stress protein [Streptomycetaceae]AEW98072.1 stress-inducible protein [Streptantibioticus cattleyicolor NRRL 8057 = DSM 46488]MYS62466.1 universal stress protein [Streptomyces sp. SID5468]CCB78388.1 conserved protein of unknown function [Streptantibioticus cattleyicolor NRRL 8057 = DSM 46488]
MGEQAGNEPRIVVGVDGSASSRAALTWALRQAELTGAVVEAVLAWQPPDAWYGLVPPAGTLDAYREAAGGVLARALAETVDAARASRVRSRVAEGNPAAVLLEAARGAELLVVGHRGHGFAGALIGSVGLHCTHHAPCPVAVVRGDPASGGTTEGHGDGRHRPGP